MQKKVQYLSVVNPDCTGLSLNMTTAESARW